MTHVVETKWREAIAATLEEKVNAIEEWLDHTDDLVVMFEDEEIVTAQLRSAAAIVRTARNNIAHEARAFIR